MPLFIREASPADKAALLQVHVLAFGQDEESQLVDALLADPSAQPLLSLVAEDAGHVVGHVLLTHVELTGRESAPAASILAPLAVLPSAQRAGIGRSLIEASCERLAQRGVQLVFVLGDPSYYTRHGFRPARPYGLRAPYAIEPEAAWMVRALAKDALGHCQGTIQCADALLPERYWRE